ncbi:MAG: helix-turn-helix domain containing protein [Proteobacteria bacterium]|nr:helix-turn-helix domain containing protein [Pseudomonadota bacterium]
MEYNPENKDLSIINMDNVDNKSRNFELIVERLKLKFGFRTDKEFANAIEMSPTAFNGRKKSASIPYPEIIDFAYRQNMNLHWVLTGEGVAYNSDHTNKEDKPAFIRSNETTDEQYSSENNKSPNVIIIKHQDLVKRFKNPEKGLQNNEHLIGIENISDALYEKASDYLKTIHETAKIMKQEIEDTQKKQGQNESSIKKQVNGK